MSQIINIVPTTELEAINSMLAAIGEAPIAQGQLDAPTMADVTIAINHLRNATREMLSMGWRFNSEHGYQLVPNTTFAWTGVDGSTATLNIFTPPANLLRFDVTKTIDQQGGQLVDTVIRPSRKYTVASLPVLVFYDRIRNRDGWATTERSYLYIEPVWAFDFNMIPEEARRFATVLAARRFIQDTVGSTTLAGFTQRDESMALRNLKWQHGLEDEYNIMRQGDSMRALGGRPYYEGGVYIDPNRKSTGTV